MLGLAYYSNNLLQNMVMDATLSTMVVREMVKDKAEVYSVADMILKA